MRQNTKKVASRFGAAFTALAAAVLLAIGLAGCQRSGDEADVSKTVESHLDALRDVNSSNADEVVWDKCNQWLSDSDFDVYLVDNTVDYLGMDADELYDAWFDVYKYRIEDILIDSDHATAQTVITCRPLLPAFLSAIPCNDDELDEFMAEYDDYDGDFQDTETMKEFFSKRIISHVEDGDLAAYTVTFDLDKINGEWQIDTASDNYSGFLNAIIGYDDARQRLEEYGQLGTESDSDQQ